VKGQIPESHLDLVNGPRVAALTTVMPDGQLQTTVVWCNYDGTHVRVNTMRDFRKEKNMRLNPSHSVVLRPATAPELCRRAWHGGGDDRDRCAGTPGSPLSTLHRQVTLFR
jgi:hypothetical protein